MYNNGYSTNIVSYSHGDNRHVHRPKEAHRSERRTTSCNHKQPEEVQPGGEFESNDGIVYMPFAHRISEAWAIIPDWQEEAIKAYCLGILSVRPLNMVTGAIADGISLFRK